MANTLDWKSSGDRRDLVHIAVQALVEGRLVVLPSETAYHVFASGLKPDAVFKLTSLVENGRSRRPCVFLRSPQEALDYSPDLSLVAGRMINRGWPGPLVLELPANCERSLVCNLTPDVRSRLLVDGAFLPQRASTHEAIIQSMRLLPGPLVAATLITAEGRAICSGIEAARSIGDAVALLLNDGQTHHGGFATTVRVEGELCRLVSPGVIDITAVQRLSQLIVVLVCTGNTCRSPMAETLMRHLISQRFPQLFQGEFPPVTIASAGLSAFPGGPASTEAVEAMRKRGLNLQNHQSHSVSERTLRHADLVLTMTKSHRSAILEKMPELASKVQLLSGGTGDVADPFGGDASLYEACADQMEEYLKSWLKVIEESWFPRWQNELT